MAFLLEMSTADDSRGRHDQLLSGAMLLLIDGLEEVTVFDVRQYVVRGSTEPSLKVTRGSRDGFVETALFNINLIRGGFRPKFASRRCRWDAAQNRCHDRYINELARSQLCGSEAH